MSVGELFDFARPAFLFLTIILSTLILYHALRRGMSAYVSLAWAMATFVLPVIVLPIYLLVQLNRSTNVDVPANRSRILVPVIYGILGLAIMVISEYHSADQVETHLVRATHAKLAGDKRRTIAEYRAALAREDNAHTRKLLAVELSDAGDWEQAVSEFRLAERGGELDGTIPFRIGEALEALNQKPQALVEYTRFLKSQACVQPLPDSRCEIAKTKIQGVKP